VITATTDLDITFEAIRARGWQAVLLHPRSKVPAVKEGEHVCPTRDLDAIRHHVDAGGNLALRTHEEVGLVILDADDLGGWDSMVTVLGDLGPSWVKTGSGKSHFYVRWEPNLPGTITWRGKRLGECFRGPGTQQVLIPPSTHPITGRRYVWLVDPTTEPLRPLPEAWRTYFSSHAALSRTAPRSGFAWAAKVGGPPLARVELAAALAQPGARRRGDRVKFQCAGCRAEGHDAHMDNAIYFIATNTWGCAFAADTDDGLAHWTAIGRALGALEERSR
jgi:hypothetical protein